MKKELVIKLAVPETPWGIYKELSKVIISVTFTTPREIF